MQLRFKSDHVVSADSPDAREIVRRLVASAAPTHEQANAGLTPALRAAYETSQNGLIRWFGPAGARALYTRAIMQAQPEHPVLERARARYAQDGNLDNVFKDLTTAHDDTVVSAALEAVLIKLFELLGRLVGDDMAARIVEPPAAPGPAQDKGST